ncbi:MAG: FAD-dependent oxidoreductase [Candidatus Omnitrophota bacterium]|jgi:NADPH-dependent 2,4-dienoyl-CoA reductase/sulfur reductase-like enzyme/peroxiredoxin family protein/TusA-related sulfurtransferase/rhodanese-related sulfurtransferase
MNMRVLIVGGVAGGASAAARARRLSEDAEIIMFERGEHISFANCGLPYHIGGAIADRERLIVQTPEATRKTFRIDVRTRTEVFKIDPAKKIIFTRELATGAEREEPYDFLVLSPGAEPARPPLPGIHSSKIMTLRNLADMDAIKKALETLRPERALVVGGGYIGLEMTEALREKQIPVTLVELTPQVMAPADPEMAAPLHQELSLHGVDLRLGASVKAFREETNALYAELSTGESLACGLAILAIGVKPETSLAKDAGLKIGPRGGILVDNGMRTSDPSIFAVGDAIEVKDFVTDEPALVPLAGPANRQGRIAADNIFGRNSVYKKTQGTAICKVFDLAIGMTGASEKTLKRLGLPYEKIYVHAASHASYYPNAFPISLKLVFDPVHGKILGAQAVGPDGVDKRIDVIATALRAGLTVYDLEHLELSYAPPYGSAKDPVNYAGFVASNVLRGDVRICHARDLESPEKNQRILDVRPAGATGAGVIPGASHLPLEELRDRLAELSKDKEYLVYCKVGLRGYLACRILTQNGFKCKNLSGGYETYRASLGISSARLAKPEMKTDTNERDERKEPVEKKEPAVTIKEIDACGLQCPGPILRIKTEIEKIRPGESLRISATDPGFAADVRAWCQSTGHELAEFSSAGKKYHATILKKEPRAVSSVPSSAGPSKKKTIVVFSSDFDKVMAAFVIANGALAMGSEVTMFFTFWGLNALRKPKSGPVKKNFIETMFGFMMPKGAEKLALSKMNMGGMGLQMIKGIMKEKNVASLTELIQSARASGAKLVACSMSMDLMGIKKEELLDGVEAGGVAMYLENAERGNVNLFI